MLGFTKVTSVSVSSPNGPVPPPFLIKALQASCGVADIIDCPVDNAAAACTLATQAAAVTCDDPTAGECKKLPIHV
jgi:hypothetical protein